jgi:transposase-like protein
MLSNSFKWKNYEEEIILLNVRWYLKYPLNYRNLKEMMIERRIQVDHSTIYPFQKSHSIANIRRNFIYFRGYSISSELIKHR